MEPTTLNPIMTALLLQHELHTNLFNNVIDGISDEDAIKRVNQINHIAWLAGNLVSLRYKLTNALGITAHEKFEELFKNNLGLRNDFIYPPLKDIRADWNKISPTLFQRLSAITDEDLQAPQPFPIPAIQEKSLLATITFLSHREAYGIGQIGLLRKIYGYPSMSYKINPILSN